MATRTDRSMPKAAVPTAPRRGRRPDGEVQAAILDAAGHILMTEGTSGLAIERVAALAGVSKMTIYNRWPSRGALIVEAYARTVDGELSVPDTGDIETDLTEHLVRFVHVLAHTRGGRVTAGLLGAAQADPALANAFRKAYVVPRRAVGLAALESARARGQLAPDVDLEVLSDQLWGACMYRLMSGIHSLDAEFVTALVRNVFTGVRGELA